MKNDWLCLQKYFKTETKYCCSKAAMFHPFQSARTAWNPLLTLLRFLLGLRNRRLVPSVGNECAWSLLRASQCSIRNVTNCKGSGSLCIDICETRMWKEMWNTSQRFYSLWITSCVSHKWEIYRMFEKELCNGIPNVTVWRMLRKRLYLRAYKVSIVQDVERWIVSTP
jgi:hypothetical protein